MQAVVISPNSINVIWASFEYINYTMQLSYLRYRDLNRTRIWLTIVVVDDELKSGYYNNRTRNCHIGNVQRLAFSFHHYHHSPTITTSPPSPHPSLLHSPPLKATSPPPHLHHRLPEDDRQDDFNRRQHHYVARDSAYDNEGHRSRHPLCRGHPDRCHNHLHHHLPHYHTPFANVANSNENGRAQPDTSYHKDEDEEGVGLRNAECRVWKGSWGEQNEGGQGEGSKGGCGKGKRRGEEGLQGRGERMEVVKDRRVGAE
ncbi:hypothetical protein D9613_011580 [Agrocybe pediades]|uniref:Uncharacterized protein n=1 Tax=Agrocybe pediades TaxID=84607 RepID=A0A8H4QVK8_9AGAR|nr:hypothetical protein D9613_011578 [Agrocybe pediades]KAF4618335.1 hypothetical protein D9613_011580 [Agrocybe pediades]